MIFPHHVIGTAPATEKPLGHEGQPRQRVIQAARLGKEQPSGTHGTRVAQPVTCLHATGTTGRLLHEELGLAVTCFRSGPLGGDQQIGARIADGEIDLLVFLWDPLEPQPHDHDVKALLRIAVVWNIPIACNRASADFLISSPLMGSEYEHLPPNYEAYVMREIGWE